MKKSLILLLYFSPIQVWSQIALTQWDLPNRGETYSQQTYEENDLSRLPADLFVEDLENAQTYDFSQYTNGNTNSTEYTWVEGSQYELDFPDANMMTLNEEEGNYNYFIKREDGLYLSGTAGAFEGPLGNMNQAFELRPALPIIKVPTRLGDEVSQVSRTTIDILTFGKVYLTITTDYKVTGFGTLKLENEELEVLKISRIITTETIFNINLGGETIGDTTVDQSGSIELFTKGYGDFVAKVDTFTNLFEEELTSFISLKAGREISAIASLNKARLNPFPNPFSNTLSLNTNEAGTVRIVNLHGQEVYSQVTSLGNESISLEGIEPGIYLLYFIGKSGQTYQPSRISKIINN